jgi:hypothetical protein
MTVFERRVPNDLDLDVTLDEHATAQVLEDLRSPPVVTAELLGLLALR